jgi:hypothetical protein
MNDKSRRAAAVVACALAVSALFQLAGIVGKRQYLHDESISYLLASGKAAEYAHVDEGAPPYGQWAPASEWRWFTQFDEPFCFEKIRYANARYDNHPPFYFWLLHLWGLMFGMHVWVGPLLNVLLVAAAGAALFGLALRLLGDAREAALVTAIWALCPSVIATTFEARQYQLLTLCAIVFIWQAIRYADRERKVSWASRIALALSAAVGTLTHYYFIFPVSASGVYLLVMLWRRDRRRLAEWIVLTGLSCSMLFVLHPEFRLSFGRQHKDWKPFAVDAFLDRLWKVVSAFSGLIAFMKDVKYPFIALVAVGLLWFAWRLARDPRGVARRIKENSRGFTALFFMAWPAAGIVLFYLAFFSHELSMRDKYLSLVWPFYAFVPVFLLRFLHRGRGIALAALFCVMAYSDVQVVRNQYLLRGADPAPMLRRADAVLVDDAARGFFIRISTFIPPDKPLFLANIDDLLARPDLWRDRLGERAVYISDQLAEYGTEHYQEELVALLPPDYEAVRVPGGIWGLGDVWEFRRKTAP